jgi:hypothetical protein
VEVVLEHPYAIFQHSNAAYQEHDQNNYQQQEHVQSTHKW